MKEKKITADKFNVPLDITGSEYEKLKDNLDAFNDTCKDRLTFDEFVSLTFKTAALEEKLDLKRNHLNILKGEIDEIENELASRYCIGLEDAKKPDEVIGKRKRILKDSSAQINGLY